MVNLRATDEDIDAWLSSYRAALEQAEGGDKPQEGDPAAETATGDCPLSASPLDG